MSGGLIYEWTQEANNYGIIETYSNGSAQLRGDYDALMDKYSNLNMTLIENHNTTATNLKAPKCSSGLVGDNGVSTNFDIPSAPSGVSDMISSGVDKKAQGSIVPVTKTSVEVSVFATGGGKISGLKISPGEGSNRTSGGLSTGAPSSSPTGSSNGSDSDSGSGSGSGSSGPSSTPGGEDASSTSASDSAAGRTVIANGAAMGAVVGLALFAL